VSGALTFRAEVREEGGSRGEMSHHDKAGMGAKKAAKKPSKKSAKKKK